MGPAGLLMLVAMSTSFNLEPRIAIVKHGEPDSYFGFSVSLHQIVLYDRLESLLLVGEFKSGWCWFGTYAKHCPLNIYLQSDV